MLLLREPPTAGPTTRTAEPVAAEWTELSVGGEVIANWHGAFAEARAELDLFLCSCGVPGCETSGYVRTFRIGDHLLLAEIPRRHFEADALHTTTPPAWVIAHGAVAIPRDVWTRWSATTSEPLAAFDAFGPPTRADLLMAWLYPTPWRTSPQDRQGLERWFDTDLLATTGPETARAALILHQLAAWFYADLDAAVDGADVIMHPELETLFFGAPASLPQWDAFDRSGTAISAWGALGIRLPDFA